MPKRMFAGSCGVILASVACMAATVSPQAYVTLCCTMPATVSVLDPGTGLVLRQFPNALGASVMAPSPDFSSVYILTQVDGHWLEGAPGAANSIIVLSLPQGDPVAVIPLSVSPFAIAFNHAGNMAYVAAADSHNFAHLLTIDTATLTVISDHSEPRNQFGPSVQMLVSADDSQLFIVPYENTAVWAIDTTSFQTTEQFSCTTTY